MRVATLAASLALLLLAAGPAAAATAYYVDSANRAATQDGRSPATAWSTLAQVNAATFGPGDVINLQRGSVFAGALAPRGSGAVGAPIALVASGSGARPRIDGGTAPAVLKLFNQEQWEISGLEITGGGQYGVWISGDAARAFSHIRLRDCVVHGAWSTPRWDSGLVVVAPYGVGTRFSDVVIDGVTAYDTNLWFGIHVGFNLWAGDPAPDLRSTDVAIRDCVVHDVYGDNITVADTNRAVIERNTVWNGGRAPAGVSYTPNAIWSWSSDAVTVQLNEAYGMASYGVDGGAFDIDWGSTNTLIQYNYAHDNQGYGVAVFGAHNVATTNSVVRYNVFADDHQAEVVVFTWDGGWLDGVAIVGNTLISDQGGLNCGAVARGAGAMTFRDNLVVSGGASLLACSEPAMAIDHDLGWRPGGSASGWNPAWGPFADPRLSDPGYHAVGFPTTSLRLQAGSPAIGAGVVQAATGPRDFFGTALPAGGAIAIGAHQLAASPPPPTRAPYGGAARAIPGTIQAEDFDEGGEGVAYHDLDPTNNGGGYRATGVDIRGCVDAGGGWQVGWMGAGEWLEYSVSVASAGSYDIAARVASGSAGATIHVSIDGVDASGPLDFGNTGGWDSWSTVVRRGAALAGGAHVLRVSVDGGSLDLNAITVTAVVPPPPPPGGGAAPVNVLLNPGFEADGRDTQTPQAWGEWGGGSGQDLDASYAEAYGGAHGGGWHGTHWKPTAYETYTWQTAIRLANGTYTLSAWVKGSGGQTYAWMEAKDFGGGKPIATIPATSSWTRITIEGIAVTAGQCTVGFYSRAGAGQWIYFDDVQLVRGGVAYGTAPAAVPGRIQAEDFDLGGEGVAYHDLDAGNNGGGYRATGVDIRGCIDAGGGWQVGWMGPGEWLQYTVDAAAGTYDLAARVASGASGATIRVSIDGVDVSGALGSGNTGGWDAWSSVGRGGIAIPAGRHVIRVTVESGALDLNWLQFTPSAAPAVPTGTALRASPAPRPRA